MRILQKIIRFLKNTKIVDKTTLDNAILTMSETEKNLSEVRVRLAINKNTYDNNGQYGAYKD